LSDSFKHGSISCFLVKIKSHEIERTIHGCKKINNPMINRFQVQTSLILHSRYEPFRGAPERPAANADQNGNQF
jgi:hypothetical protein